MRFRKLFFILVFFLIITPLVLSADDKITITPTSNPSEDTPEIKPSDDASTINDITTKGETNPDTKKNLSDFSKDPKDALKDVGNATKTAFETGITSGIDDSEVPTIALPAMLKKPTIAIFAVKNEESLSLEKFFILICLFFIFIIGIYEIVSISTFQETTSAVISFCLTAILSITGQINKYCDKIIYYGEGLKILSFLPDWYYVVLIIGVGILIYLSLNYIKVFLRKIKLEKEVDESFKKGFKQRVAQKKVETLSTVADSND